MTAALQPNVPASPGTAASRELGGGSLQRQVRRRATEKSVRDLSVTAKLRAGQIIVEQAVCGVVFSFPAAVWPSEHVMQWSWIVRLTPWWDVPRQDWTPQAHRLREACQKAINNLAAFQREPKGARDHQATPDTGGSMRLETHRSADGVESPNDEAEARLPVSAATTTPKI